METNPYIQDFEKLKPWIPYLYCYALEACFILTNIMSKLSKKSMPHGELF